MRISTERPSSYHTADTYRGYDYEAYEPAISTLPTNPGFNPATPLTQSIPPMTSTAPGVQGPPTVMDMSYIPGYLASNIGKTIRAEFVVGQNIQTDRLGVLKEVGVNYFVLHDPNTNSDFMADLYSVRFVTVFN